MVRIVNKDKGILGKGTKVLAVLGDGANESHYNLNNAFFNSVPYGIMKTNDNKTIHDLKKLLHLTTKKLYDN